MDTLPLSQIKSHLITNNLDGALISSLPTIVYLTNFSYFTDLEREAFLIITKKNNYIITDNRYSHAVKKYLPHFTLLELSQQNSLSVILRNIIKQENIFHLGLEEKNITVHEFKKITQIVKKTSNLEITSLRLTKTNDEIKNIKKACAIADKAFIEILKNIKIGMTEKELAFLLENVIRKQGVILSFSTIVAFGENAAVPHHKTGNRKLKKNEFILLDFGVIYENYCSDMTRTIFFGKADSEQKKIYQTVLNAQKQAIKQFNNLSMKQSIEAALVDKVARDYIVKQNYPTIPHSLGHGIGLQVHEAPSLSPNSKDTLTEGMVFSIEPGIYLPDKMGVRIEDLFTIKNNKLIRLTKSSTQFMQIS